MLDLKWIREHREDLERMLKQRLSKLDIAPLYDLDTERRKILTELEKLQALRNASSKTIGNLRAKEDPSQQRNIKVVGSQLDIKSKIKELETKLNSMKTRLDEFREYSVVIN